MIIWLIIGIVLCVIALYVINHDTFARASLADKHLNNQANSTNDCFLLHLMTDDHKDDWFKDNYVKVAEKRMEILKCP